MTAGQGKKPTWERIRQYFERAVELEPAEREIYLQTACGEDVLLRAEVRAMLAEHDRASGLLATGPSVLDATRFTLQPGDCLSGRFEIIRPLGAGGMGEVYEVHDRELGERVALKTIRPKLLFDPGFRERFQHEILNGRKVAHQNVCRIHDLVLSQSDDSSLLAFTMELLDGETLAERLRRDGRLSAEDALPLVRQMADGLTALHERGVIHRRFKPSNIFLTATERGDPWIKITDFGLACSHLGSKDSPVPLTAPQDFIGTPYMAPEQLRERDNVGPATDVYALGLVLYEMLTAAYPFPTQNLIDHLDPKIKGTPAPPGLYAPGLERHWDHTILSCLSANPEARPQSPREVLQMLEGRPKPPAMVRRSAFEFPVTGAVISHYRLLEKLGEGGMGEVWKAEDLQLRRIVALKFLSWQAIGDDEMRARLVREAQAAASLDHPNICAVHDVHDEAGETFIVMAYIDGPSLAEKIKRSPLPLDEALTISIQTAEGLEEAHSKHVVHRDIKPTNIMIRERSGSRFVVTVMDFGLAQLFEATKLTAENRRVGTAAYMSPEQVQGAKVDHRTDIWALGVTIYEMLIGRCPFQADHQEALFYAILHEQPKPMTSLRTGVPVELERVVAKCIAKSPNERYQSITDLVVDLRALEKSSLLEKANGSSNGIDRRVWHLSWPHVLAILSVAVLLASAPWLFRLFRPSQPSSSAPIRLSPLTALEGSEHSATFSPEGNQVAFSWDGEGRRNYDIYVQVIGSEHLLRLTEDPADDVSPAWSPDGRQIAFLRSVGRSITERGSIHLLSPLGGRERRLAPGNLPFISNFSGLAWTPDSRFLVFSESKERDELPSIYILDVTTEELHRLTIPQKGSLGDFYPCVSPDGKTLAFVRMIVSGVSGIYLVPMTGGSPRSLFSGAGTIRGLDWTPDGEEIVYSWGVLGQSHRLWIVSVASASPRRLASVGEDGLSPVISRHSGALVYARSSPDRNIWRYDMPKSGTNPSRTKIIASTRDERSPQIAPNGDGVAFASNRSGNSEVWTAGIDGSQPIQLTSSNFFSGSPRWSPDGRNIAFDSLRDGDWNIYVVGAQGGPSHGLVVREGTDSRPSWSADGKWVYFNSDVTKTDEIWKAPVDGGDPVRVTSLGGYNPFESRDGKFVYYGKRGQVGLWRMPVAGGPETIVINSLDAADQGFWDLTDHGVYFLARRVEPSGASRWSLNFLDFHAQRIAAITDLGGQPGSAATPFDISPNGEWFVYTQVDQSESDLTLVDDFWPEER